MEQTDSRADTQTKQIDTQIQQILNISVNDPEFITYMQKFNDLNVTNSYENDRFISVFQSEKLKSLCDNILRSNPSPEMVAQVIRSIKDGFIKDMRFRMTEYEIKNNEINFFLPNRFGIENYIYDKVMQNDADFNCSFRTELNVLIETYICEKLIYLLNRYKLNIYNIKELEKMVDFSKKSFVIIKMLFLHQI